MRITSILFLGVFVVVNVSSQPCYRPEVPVHAAIIPDADSYLDGSSISYICTYGYIPTEGEIHRTCVNGTWTDKAPLCLGKFIIYTVSVGCRAHFSLSIHSVFDLVTLVLSSHNKLTI